MQIFILENVGELTTNWHSGGGLVVIAEDEKHAREIVSERSGAVVADEEWAEAQSFPLYGTAKPDFWLFPDAGCC